MREELLVVYSRKGCCLCEGLEERLRSLSLTDLKPPLSLHVVDIDAVDTPKEIRIRYDSQVPVMFLGKDGFKGMVAIPRVSPRLSDEALFRWLQQILIKNAGPN